MKHTVLTLVAVLLIALLAIGGWYLTESSRLQSESDAFAAESAAREMVEVSFLVDVPDSTPDDQIVYVSGSHPNLGGWQAAGLPLMRGDDGKYHGRAELLSGIEHEFKITRGTWGTVERDADDQDVPNRPFVAEADATLEVAVAEWVDKGLTEPGRQTVVGQSRLIAKFPSEHLELPRDLIVYLPPSYDNPDQADARYPVLYLNDGQNLFNEATSFAGVEWRLDEALQQLIANDEIDPMIVVGIYNTENRTAEYTPGHSLDDYVMAVVKEIKPMIDKRYRTQPDFKHTSIGGSSLGGLAAIAIAHDYPEVFSQVVALSPWLSIDGKPAADLIAGELAFLSPVKVYFDMGDAPTDNYPAGADPVADAEAFAVALDSAGVDYTFAVIQGADHHEDDWAARIVDVLKLVYGP
ncbi:MAG: alpha/beta hydrolase-fold protein [Planctomycetota bacterium]